MADKTTKALLLAIAIGIWGNLLGVGARMIQPVEAANLIQAAQPQDPFEHALCLPNAGPGTTQQSRAVVVPESWGQFRSMNVGQAVFEDKEGTIRVLELGRTECGLSLEIYHPAKVK